MGKYPPNSGISPRSVSSLRTCILFVTVAVYLVIINAALFYIIYHPHNRSIVGNNKDSIVHSLFMPVHNTQANQGTPRAQALTECSVYADLFVAVVPTAQEDMPYSTTAMQYTRVLGELRRATNNIKLFILIIVTVETLHPEHRKFCKMNAYCSITMVQNTKPNTILQACQSKQLCAEHILLLSDRLHIDLSFLNRLRLLPRHRISCLLSDTKQSNIYTISQKTQQRKVGDICPALAFSTPLNITLATDNTDLVEHAVRNRIYGGNFPVVSELS